MKSFFRPLDLIFLILFAAAAIFSILGLKDSGQKKYAVISTKSDSFIYPLEEDRLLQIEGKLGKSTIEIKDGRASFSDSPCRNKICQLAGKLSKNGDWAACLPQGIFLKIEGNTSEAEDSDAISK